MAALVAPHTIKSSRFFQTRLSHPPRTIAFVRFAGLTSKLSLPTNRCVRLDTRTACEDIIKRLHGRMVRGRNDPGSRISVRFADSAEQRELRVRIYATTATTSFEYMLQRSERSGRGDDSSPARLTMAQAALLNLRGQQIQGRLRVSQHPTTLSDQRRLLSAQSPVGVNDLPNLHHPQHSRLPPHPIISQGQSDPENSFLTTSHSSPARLHGRNDLSGGLPNAFGSDIDLSALSRTAGTNGFTPLEQQLILQARLQAEIDTRQRALYGPQNNNTSGGPIQTLSLFSEQSEELSRSMNNVSLRPAHIAKEFIPRGLASRLHQPPTYSSSLSHLSADLLPSEVADGYHVSKSQNSQQPQSLPFTSCQQQQHSNASVINPRVLNLASKDSSLKNNNSPNMNGDNGDGTVRSSNSLDLVADSSDRRGSTQREEQQNLAAHMRSTTLPPHFTVSGSNTTHSTGVVSLQLNGILSPNLTSGARVGVRGQIGKPSVGVPSGELAIKNQIDALPTDTKLTHPHNSVADSPFLIPSPALTYNSSSSASSRTPSTLSPSTPFFGSFPHPSDSYGAYNGEEHGGDKTDAAMAHDVTAFDIGTKIRSGSG